MLMLAVAYPSATNNPAGRPYESDDLCYRAGPRLLWSRACNIMLSAQSEQPPFIAGPKNQGNSGAANIGG